MRPARWLAVLAACAPLGACGACEPDPSAAPDAGPAASVARVLSPPLPAPPPRPHVELHAPCRAIAVDGDTHLEGPGTRPDAAAPMAVQDRIPGDVWIDLGAKGRLVVRDPRTARETTAAGPGRVRMCVDSQEESWLAGDTVSFESSPGSGEAPGSEEWVVTELGVIRYSAARLGVQARPGAIALAVTDGVAFVWPAQDATFALPPPARDRDALAAPPASDADGWERVVGPARATLSPRPRVRRDAPARAVAGAVAQCTQLATRTRELAAALLAPPEGRSAGDTARPDASLVADPVEQVRTRRLARAACAVASLRSATVVTTDDAAGFERALKQADSAWRELPSAPAAPTTSPTVEVLDLREPREPRDGQLE
jgi:hypothetical protein